MYKKILCLLSILLFTSCASAVSTSELERTIQAQGQMLIDNQQRINDLQSELDSLRGKLEETTYQLNQTIERQRTILQQLSSGTAPSTSSGSNSSSSSPSSQSLSSWFPSGNDKTDYNFIIKFVNDNKQNNNSIAAFQQFLQNYPKSSYRANVNYWLGQLFYRQGKKDDASFYYATVVKSFPSSSKAADSLYKVGFILLEKGDKAKAKVVFQQVISKYSNDKNAVALANKKLASL